MIISASRRTDIPAFYTPWFIRRIREGYCTVPNPFNRKQVSRISLAPSDVSVIVFWTRYALPLLSKLKQLDQRGYRYFFQYTLMNNPRLLDPKKPSYEKSIEVFLRVADHVGPDRMIWRYDPIVLSKTTDIEFHLEAFDRLSRRVGHHTQTAVISIVDIYRKNRKRLKAVPHLTMPDEQKDQYRFNRLIKGLSEIAQSRNLFLNSCAQEENWSRFGVANGKCIDDGYLSRVFSIHVGGKKDPSQRKACGCVVSRDIGSYDTCLFGCRYCYATSSFKLAAKNYRAHQIASPSMMGWYAAPESVRKNKPGEQLKLWDV